MPRVYRVPGLDPNVNIPLTFINKRQERFFNNPKRNKCACGGFGSGKTYCVCQQILFLSMSFNFYRTVVAREQYKALKHTTMSTFFKVCPPELYEPPLGRFNEQDGYLRFVNGSEVLFMHLDAIDENTLRGLEINSAFIDQAEEVNEGIADILEARIGRWDMAVPNNNICTDLSQWPKNHAGRPLVPSYYWLAVNPEDETHWIWRRYHPDSEESAKWADTHYYEEFPSDENPALDPETLKVMMSRDPAWVKRFVHGKWGISEGSIHRLLPDSILDVDKKWVDRIIREGSLYRVLDHGDASPTCCLWFSAYKNWHICYREYYQAGLTVSQHRRNIERLSKDEVYRQDIADPAIFKEQSQKYGGFWSVAKEYSDPNVEGKPINFSPGDNEELSTRNRINEYFSLNAGVRHPLNINQPSAPLLYFVKKNEENPNGCYYAINEIRTQRRLKLGDLNGKPIFSDERDDRRPDHAYDPIRYYVASHFKHTPSRRYQAIPENSFLGYRRRIKMLKMAEYKNSGFPRPAI